MVDLKKVEVVGELVGTKQSHWDPEFCRFSRILQKIAEGFSRRATPLTHLTQKGVKFQWLDESKKHLVSTPILTLLVSCEAFTIYSDDSKKGLGCVLMQKDKIIAYDS